MKRKVFINRLALSTGGGILFSVMPFVQSCEYKPKNSTKLSETDIPFLDEIGETIIPSTAGSPGAKAAEIGRYMLLMYQDCMSIEDQNLFVNGLNELDQMAFNLYSCPFIEANSSQKLTILEQLQKDATEVPKHYFNLFKQLSLSGYFSSEIGMTQARNYLPLPGKFEACISYNRGDKPWAT